MSKLVEHAKREMTLAGLADRSGMYDGMLYDAVLELVETFAKQGHSGGSASIVVPVLSKLLSWKTLSPVTSDPSEWMEVGTDTWQNNRCPSTFSVDGGKTWYDLDDPEKTNFPPHLQGGTK